jgi:hypothetical protein
VYHCRFISNNFIQVSKKIQVIILKQSHMVSAMFRRVFLNNYIPGNNNLIYNIFLNYKNKNGEGHLGVNYVVWICNLSVFFFLKRGKVFKCELEVVFFQDSRAPHFPLKSYQSPFSPCLNLKIGNFNSNDCVFVRRFCSANKSVRTKTMQI